MLLTLLYDNFFRVIAELFKLKQSGRKGFLCHRRPYIARSNSSCYICFFFVRSSIKCFFLSYRSRNLGKLALMGEVEYQQRALHCDIYQGGRSVAMRLYLQYIVVFVPILDVVSKKGFRL